MALDRQYYIEATFGEVPYHAGLVLSLDGCDRMDIRKSLARAIRQCEEKTGHQAADIRLSVRRGLMTQNGFMGVGRDRWIKELSWLKPLS